jgi:predicted nucleic acid-binding protein
MAITTISGREFTQDAARAEQAAKVPNPRPERDALIAATALVHRITVVTRNTSDFASTGVQLLNPWLPPDR